MNKKVELTKDAESVFGIWDVSNKIINLLTINLL